MFIVIATTSILGITGLVWLSNKILPVKICPICAGVSGTWLWMLAAKFLGYEIDLLIPAMLMGGSIVGIAYQLEKKLPAGRSPLLWKTLFIPAGFIAVFGILREWWGVFLFALIILLLITFLFLSGRTSTNSNKQKIDELKEKMKNCC